MSTTGGSFRGTGSSRGIRFLVALLVLAVVFVSLNFLWVARNNEQDRQYVALSTDVQVRSQQLATNASEAAGGSIDAFDELQSIRDRIDNNLTLLDQGDSASGLKPTPESAHPALWDVLQIWERVRSSADDILARTEVVRSLAAAAAGFTDNMPRLQARTEEVVQILIRQRAPQDQVYIASRQMVLADRMLRSVGEILQGGVASFTAADRFATDSALYGQVLSGMINGDTELGVVAVTNPEARAIVGEVFSVFNEMSLNIATILDNSPSLFEVKEAAVTILLDSELFLEDSTTLQSTYANLSNTRLPNVWTGLILAGIATVLLILLAAALRRDALNRLTITAGQNQRNQEAILRLLDEMGSLAEGDLTVEATVTEDITGAIADSINFAVEALRNLVETINDTSVQVASAAQETQSTAMHLAEASDHQAQEITSASSAVNDIAVSIEEVSRNSSESSQVAGRSVSIASKGAETVRRTIQGMDTIREQIQDTSKRIKRLGESSQEIGNIVELINDIAEQTNILSLNAAIQAATAGESGRGFAVVADEVQRLAERASNATKQIEALVKTIQTDTNEAVISMEQTTTEVVNGARLAEDAGEALSEIETVSKHLADLIQNISEAAQQQSAAAASISSTMNVIQEITTQTSIGTSQTAESIGNLAELATDLRRSVSGFTLPEETARS